MSNRKRILVVTRSTVAHPGSGGMEVVADDVIRHLPASNFEFALLTTQGFDAHRLEGIFSHVWTVAKARAGKYSLRWWLLSASSNSPWFSWEPDVIFSISSAATSFTLVRSWNKKAILSQCHGTALKDVMSSLSSLSAQGLAKIPLNLARSIRERVAYRRFTRIVSIGPAVTDYLIKPPLSINSERIVPIPNAVNLDQWSFSEANRLKSREYLGINSNVPLAIFTGRLHRQKGADLAIRALSQLSNQEWNLLICGEGPELAALQQLGRSLGVSHRVHFIGRVSRDRISAYLSASDLFILPTRVREGLPMSVLEALACGLPVLTAPTANLPEDVRPLVVYSSLDVTSLAESWMNIGRPGSRNSRLPLQYEFSAMIQQYRLLLDGI